MPVPLMDLRAHEIAPGDEVICPAYTFYATAEAVAVLGAKPVFADILPGNTYVLDPAAVEAAITPLRRARPLRDVLLLPDQEPLLPRRRWARDHLRPRARGRDPEAPLPRLARQVDVRARRRQLSPGRAA